MLKGSAAAPTTPPPQPHAPPFSTAAAAHSGACTPIAGAGGVGELVVVWLLLSSTQFIPALASPLLPPLPLRSMMLALLSEWGGEEP